MGIACRLDTKIKGDGKTMFAESGIWRIANKQSSEIARQKVLALATGRGCIQDRRKGTNFVQCTGRPSRIIKGGMHPRRE